MPRYLIDITYRHGPYGDDKDWFQKEIEADTDQEAHVKAKELRVNITKTKILKKDGKDYKEKGS